MSDKPERIDIPTGGTLIGAFRAFRAMVEAKAKAEGRELDPAWYEDDPEDRPGLYPHLKKEQTNEDQPESDESPAD